jgi:transposase-like protein
MYIRCTYVHYTLRCFMDMDFFKFQKKFSTEKSCYKFLYKQRWPNGFICPRCYHTKYSYITKRKLYQCKNCKYQVSVTAGTIFHKSRKPLKKWFWMIFILTRSKTGQSIRYLQKVLGIGCYKTAWTMAHKIHKAMQERESNYKLAGIIEIDDAYFGERKVTGKRGRGAGGKCSVMLAIGTRIYKGKEKPSYLKMHVINNMKKENVESYMDNNISKNSKIKTDMFKSYAWMSHSHFEHNPIKIDNPKNTMDYLPWVHIIIGNVKGIIKGVHHGVSAKHLERFLGEYCYRFNRRFIENNMFINLIKACANTQTITFAELKT